MHNHHPKAYNIPLEHLIHILMTLPQARTYWRDADGVYTSDARDLAHLKHCQVLRFRIELDQPVGRAMKLTLLEGVVAGNNVQSALNITRHSSGIRQSRPLIALLTLVVFLEFVFGFPVLVTVMVGVLGIVLVVLWVRVQSKVMHQRLEHSIRTAMLHK